MRNSILYDRGGRKKDESLGPVSKTGARAITHDRWVGRAFPEGPTGRGEEMGFGGEGEWFGADAAAKRSSITIRGTPAHKGQASHELQRSPG